jgi:hypothetical protein
MERDWNEMDTSAYTLAAQLLDEFRPADFQQLCFQAERI